MRAVIVCCGDGHSISFNVFVPSEGRERQIERGTMIRGYFNEMLVAERQIDENLTSPVVNHPMPPKYRPMRHAQIDVASASAEDSMARIEQLDTVRWQICVVFLYFWFPCVVCV